MSKRVDQNGTVIWPSHYFARLLSMYPTPGTSLIWAGYYKGCAFLILVNYQFSVKYGGTVHCSKNSLIWFFRPCPLSSARSGGSVQRERECLQVNETYIFEILIQNGVDWWVLDPSNPKKIFGPFFSSFLSSCYCEGLSRITSWRFTYPEGPIRVWPLKLKLRVSYTWWLV